VSVTEKANSGWVFVTLALCVIERVPHSEGLMARTTKKKTATKKKTRRRGEAWTKAMHAELKKHSKAKTPIAEVSKLMKRTVGALRQQAIKLGIGLGHRR
jgi:hypothetical protein